MYTQKNREAGLKNQELNTKKDSLRESFFIPASLLLLTTESSSSPLPQFLKVYYLI